MDNNLQAAGEMKTADIVALSNTKEIPEISKGYAHLVLLFSMLIIALILVFLSVFNFGSLAGHTQASAPSYKAQLRLK